MNLAHMMIVSVPLAVWRAALFVRDGLMAPGVERASIKFTHALPAAIQGIIFGYWAS